MDQNTVLFLNSQNVLPEGFFVIIARNMYIIMDRYSKEHKEAHKFSCLGIETQFRFYSLYKGSESAIFRENGLLEGMLFMMGFLEMNVCTPQNSSSFPKIASIDTN